MKLQKYEMCLSDKNIIEIKRQWVAELPNIGDACDGPSVIDQIMRDYLQIHKYPEEHVYMICTDNKLKNPILFEIGIGTATSAIVNTKGILQRALLANASTIVLIHNHPSGDTTFSQIDINIIKNLNATLDLVGMTLNDAIVIGDGYRSAREEGII